MPIKSSFNIIFMQNKYNCISQIHCSTMYIHCELIVVIWKLNDRCLPIQNLLSDISDYIYYTKIFELWHFAKTVIINFRIVCKFNGKKVKVGETVPKGDNCNTCTCKPNGRVSCTDKKCGKLHLVHSFLRENYTIRMILYDYYFLTLCRQYRIW